MRLIRITDAADSRLDPYRLVRDRESANDSSGLFVGETALVIQCMLRVPGQTVSILAAERHEPRVREMLAGATDAPEVFLVPDHIVESIVGFNLHRGLLAIGRRPAPRTLASILPPASAPALVLCVESVNNIDNIGQLFRIAAAFGCCGVLLSPDCHDPLYRKSLRVSCGCALLLPHARSADWEADLRAVHATHGFALIGATGSGDVTLEQLAAHPPGQRLALLVGAEYTGLSPQALRACAIRARIPMAAGIDSLNVAVAAAVFLSRLSPFLQR